MTLTMGMRPEERTSAPLLPEGWFPGEPVCTGSCVSDSSVTLQLTVYNRNPTVMNQIEVLFFISFCLKRSLEEGSLELTQSAHSVIRDPDLSLSSCFAICSLWLLSLQFQMYLRVMERSHCPCSHRALRMRL